VCLPAEFVDYFLVNVYVAQLATGITRLPYRRNGPRFPPYLKNSKTGTLDLLRRS